MPKEEYNLKFLNFISGLANIKRNINPNRQIFKLQYSNGIFRMNIFSVFPTSKYIIYLYFIGIDSIYLYIRKSK